MQRLQRLQHDDDSALHVGRAGAVGPRTIAPEALAGQNRVEVTEQQQPLATRAADLRDQMSGALHAGRHFDPARAETDATQLLCERVAHGADAGNILGRTFGVHDPLQHDFRDRLALCDVLRDRTFCPVEAGVRCTGPTKRQSERSKEGAEQRKLSRWCYLWREYMNVNRAGLADTRLTPLLQYSSP